MARLYTQYEKKQRKERYQVAAGMIDFIAILVGVVVLIACVILLVTLIRWVINDFPITFRRFIEVFQKAIIIPE